MITPRAVLIFFIIFACSMQVSAREVRIEFDGRVLNADLILASQNGLTDGVMVILHGTLGHKDMEIISGLQEIFAEYSRNTLAINLSLGIDDRHGFYACDQPHSHRLQDANAELAAWVAWLTRQGVGELVLFGHSLGAYQIASFVAGGAPDVTAAILLAPPAGSRSDSEEFERTVAIAHESDWLEKIQFLHCSNASVSANSFLSYYGSSELSDTSAVLNDFRTRVPVLVVSGTQDEVAQGLAEKMTTVMNPDVTHTIIEGAGHFFRDLYLYDVVDVSLEFLDAN